MWTLSDKLMRGISEVLVVLLVGGLSLRSAQGGESEKTAAEEYWAFADPRRSALPEVSDEEWPRQRLDYFVLAKMEEAGLEPAAESEPEPLLRRLSFVLRGLPPAPEEVQQFREDSSDAAYARWVDEFLASPRYGEHLASRWLDLARYGEDQAHQVGSDRKHFYPNAHLYRQWVIDAFNQDLSYDRFIKLQLAADLMEDVPASDLPALGFLGLGPKYYNRGRLEVMADEWEDRVDTTTRTFLALTVACARCHDHKYDPITMEDYYGLAGVFASVEMVNQEVPGLEGTVKNDDEAKKARNQAPAANTMHVVKEGKVQNLPVFKRGDVGQKGEVVPRRFVQVLCEGDAKPFPEESSGRKELAEAIARPGNPLTARVMANRVWMWVYGKGLVGTPSNFGELGEVPTHPLLLDDLAARLTADGWSVKGLVREMVMSSTFRQSSNVPEESISRDPVNDLWSRMPRRRLTVEMWRDAVLHAAGELVFEEGASRELDDPRNRRRTVFGRVSRLELNPLLMQFDRPDPNVHHGKRAVTTTPVQKLYLMNNSFMLEQAERLAGRLETRAGSDAERIQFAYELLYGRAPSDLELEMGREYLDGFGDGEAEDGWVQYAHVLLAANETMFLD